MNGKTILAAALSVAILAASAQAQEHKSGPKLYRWVDKEGKVHYDDALPPEAVNQARTEFNAKSGQQTAQVGRALTEAELAQQAQAAAEAAAAAAKAEDQKHQEEVMLA